MDALITVAVAIVSGLAALAFQRPKSHFKLAKATWKIAFLYAVGGTVIGASIYVGRVAKDAEVIQNTMFVLAALGGAYLAIQMGLLWLAQDD